MQTKKLLEQKNKGFTLVELIVAVTILLAVAGPLLYSFVTAARVDNKGSKIGAATLAAQNIQEIVTGAETDAALDGSCFPTGFSSNVQVISAEDELVQLSLENVKASQYTFDAVLSFDKTPYAALNAATVPSFSSMDAVFVQPQSEEDGNPDDVAWSSFAADSPTGKLDRTITIDILKETSSLDSKEYVYARVTYYYESSSNRLSTQTYVYDLLRSGFELSETKTLNLYLMYNPWNHGDASAETLIINNTQNIKTNIFLVSQNTGITSNLRIKQMQGPGFEREKPTTKLFCNKETNVSTYQVYTNKMWYYNNLDNLTRGLVAMDDHALIYSVDISLYEPGTADTGDPVYTLTASKRG